MSAAFFSLIWKSALEFMKMSLLTLRYSVEEKAGGFSGRQLASLCL